MGASLLVCLGLYLLLLGVLPLSTGGSPATPTPLAVGGTVRLAALGGVDIKLRDADVETKRLTLVIRGPALTSLPRRTHLTTHFDVLVKQAILLETSPALRGETVSSGSLVTCELTRDPFSPPVPWYAILQVDVEELPRAGRIILWNHAEAQVIYQLHLAEHVLPLIFQHIYPASPLSNPLAPCLSQHFLHIPTPFSRASGAQPPISCQEKRIHRVSYVYTMSCG